MIDSDADDPRTIITTADGAALRSGDRAYNYYDMKPGTIGLLDHYLQPDTMKGQNSSTPPEEWTNRWFRFHHDDGTNTSLDGSRICTIQYASRKGFPDA